MGEKLHKEKTKKFQEILKKFNDKEKAQKAMTRAYLNAIDTLEMLRYKARKTIAGWPAWVSARYYKIEALPSGHCMFPAKCDGHEWQKNAKTEFNPAQSHFAIDKSTGKRFHYPEKDVAHAIAARKKFEADSSKEFPQLGTWLRLY